MKETVMKRLLQGLLGAALALGAMNAAAQAYPSQTITAIVGFSAGGSADAASRMISEEAKKILGTDIVVQNKPGASATVGVSAVMTAKPDGYTIGATTDSPFLRAPHMLKLSFDPIGDTTPLVFYAVQRNFIVVREDSPFKTFADLLKFAKDNPGKLTYGHAGVPTTLYLGFAGVANQLGIEFGNVPFPGDAQTLLAVLGGHVMAAGISAGPTMPQLKAGKVRVLAIIDGTKRMEEFPSVPTISEYSKPENVIASPGMIIFGPKNLPPDVAKKLEDAFVRAAASDSFKKWGADNQTYALAKPLTGNELREYLTADTNKMKGLIQRLGLGPK
jgi:tripartite-type tricarboxylate transporter receptor subunit TctC